MSQNTMPSICVYLGANPGANPLFQDTVRMLGQELVLRGLSLVYGGSSLGLMGMLANTVKEYGGQVIGITTSQLMEQEKPLHNLDELLVVHSMQERKQLMQQKSDKFLVMPGGLGTMEEAFDTWNAIKMGLFNKPIGFLNTGGYFDHLFSFISACEHQGFILKNQSTIPRVSSDIKELLTEL